MIRNSIKKIVLSSLMLSLGIVLPLFTSQIKEIGDSLLPMHLPVMLCGLICGSIYGASIGLFMPFIRSLIFSMPPLYPNAVWMALELAAYGFVIGFLYNKKTIKSTLWLYFSLICSMICGRVVWGLTKLILLSVKGSAFTLSAFITGGFIDALPGIIIQLILIPIVMKIVEEVFYSEKRN